MSLRRYSDNFVSLEELDEYSPTCNTLEGISRSSFKNLPLLSFDNDIIDDLSDMNYIKLQYKPLLWLYSSSDQGFFDELLYQEDIKFSTFTKLGPYDFIIILSDCKI